MSVIDLGQQSVERSYVSSRTLHLFCARWARTRTATDSRTLTYPHVHSRTLTYTHVHSRTLTYTHIHSRAHELCTSSLSIEYAAHTRMYRYLRTQVHSNNRPHECYTSSVLNGDANAHTNTQSLACTHGPTTTHLVFSGWIREAGSCFDMVTRSAARSRARFAIWT